MIKVRNLKSETSTGFQDVIFKTEDENLITELILDEIHIKATPNSDKKITVNYTYKETYKSTGKEYSKKCTYTLKDEVGQEQYEVDEAGNEIEGSAEVIKEERPYLTSWNNSIVGQSIADATRQRMAEMNGLWS